MNLTESARSLLERAVATRGFTLRPSGMPPRGFQDFLALYNRFAPAPQVVFDIGVGTGTPWLYEAFPEAHLVLIEPLRDFEPQIAEVLKTYRGECHYCALAEAEGELTLHVPRGGATGSSLLQRTPDWADYMTAKGDAGTEPRTVQVSTLDRIAAAVTGSHVVKIDVEGAELHVMRGGRACIAGADMVIVETAVAPRHSGESDFLDVGHHLKGEGFVLADIVEMATFGPHRLLAYVDAVFVRADNPFLQRARAG